MMKTLMKTFPRRSVFSAQHVHTETRLGRTGIGISVGFRCLIGAFCGWLILSALQPGPCSADAPNIRGFRVSDGLAAEIVRDIIRTKDESVWFATWGGGISRYDGTNWRTYQQADGLPHNYVRALLPDGDRGIWAGTQVGIGYLPRQDGQGRWQPIPTSIPNHATTSVYCILQRSDGAFWFGTAKGEILQFSPRSSSPDQDASGEATMPDGDWSIVLDADRTKGNSVRDIAQMSNGEVWAGVNEYGILVYTGTQWEHRWGIEDTGEKIYSLLESRDGSVWVAGEDQLYQYNGETWSPAPKLGGSSTCVNETPDGELFVGTREGIWVRRDGTWRNPVLDYRIPNPRVESVSCFSDGSTWIGTEDGAYQLVPTSWAIQRHTVDGVSLLGLTVCGDPDMPPLTTDEQGRLVQFNGSVWEPIAQLHAGNQKGSVITRPCEGRICVCFPDCVVEFSLDRKTILRSIPIPNEIQGINGLFQTRSGRLYLVTQNGAYECVEDRWERRPKKSGAPTGAARSMVEEPDGSVWVEFENHVERWKGDEVLRSMTKEDLKIDHRISAIACGEDGRTWFGSAGSGLFCWDNEILQRYTTKEGMHSDLVDRIFLASDGTVWAAGRATNLSCYRDGRWVNYTYEDGLEGRSIHGICESPKGTIWLALQNVGMACYRPTDDPPITEIQEYPRTIAPGDEGVFSFSAKDKWNLTLAKDLVYSWRIVPVAEENTEKIPWMPFERATTAVSPPLKPGGYLFEVRAADNDRNIDPTPDRAEFEILLPIWRTPAFYIPVAISLLSAVVAVVLLYRKHHSLEASEKKYRDLVESLNDVIYAVDTQAIITYVSPAVKMMMDYDPDELTGCLIDPFFPPEDLERAQATFQQILVGKTVTDEYRFRTKSGDYIWIRTSSRPHIDQKGQIVGLSGVVTDITARKHAEEALKKANDELEHRVEERTNELVKANIELGRSEREKAVVLDATLDIITFVDTDFRIVLANRAACEVLGVARDEMIGRYCYELWENISEPCTGCPILETLRTGQPCQAERTKDDGTVWLHRGYPVRDDRGITVGVVEMAQDITEQKRSREALQQSEETLRVMLNAFPEVACLLDIQGSILQGNQALVNRFRTDLQDLIGTNITDYLPTELAESRMEQIDRAFRTKKSVHFQDERDGRIFDSYLYPVLDEKAEVTRLAALAIDITDRKRSEESIHALTQELIKVQENERQRISRDLHDNVAQDLSTVRLGIQMLHEQIPNLASQHSKRIQDLCSVLQNAIMSVRDLCYNLRPAGLDQLGLSKTVFNYCEEFKEKTGIAVDFHCAGMEDITLDFDTEINLYRLVQEALNNVKNHAEATHVTIRLAVSVPTILLRIEDNGKGFDVQQRMISALAERRMGLRSMEERASLLRGTFEVQSQVGAGTTILITVPRLGDLR
ncbi:MAG TPA: PAS domain S-box protein [bacterium]|nr:PAS domain S-box protein [bacterium]